MSEQRKQRQHYLPKFLAKYFSNEINKQVLFYDGEKCEKRNIERVFSENNFYGDFNSDIEIMLASQENRAAEIIKVLNESKGIIKINRDDKQFLTQFLSFLPKRNKSMADTFSDRSEFLANLQNELKYFNDSWKPPFFFNWENTYQQLLLYMTTHWESDIELPLFVENMGMCENAWGGVKSFNGEFSADCKIDPTPDTIFFPISKNRIIIFFNQKWRIDNLVDEKYKENGMISRKAFKKESLISIQAKSSKYCERSIYTYMNLHNIWPATAKNTYKQKEIISKGYVDYSYANMNDEYEFKIMKMDKEMYKYFLLENIIWHSRRSKKYEVILPSNDKFIGIIRELANDVINNVNIDNCNSKLDNDGKIKPDDWYEYAVYKISHKETYEYILNFLKDIDIAYNE